MTIRRSTESPSGLGRSLLAKHDRPALVAFGGAGERTLDHLLRDAARVAARLPEPFPGSHVLLAIRGDRYTFAAGLLGTWARGHAAALPPDAGRDWILRLAQREDTAAVLHDTETDAPIRIDALLAGEAEIEPLESERFAVPERPVTLYAGDPSYMVRSWPKRRSELLLEANALAEHFALSPGFGVVSSVPPSQQYGLVCGVLWPLVAGGAFAREIAPAALPRAIAARQDVVLVSVPAQLRALAQQPPEQWSKVSRVISSRAALSCELPVPVTELFGSTATGTIALRERGRQSGYRALPGIEVSASGEGELLIDSPFLAPDQARPYPTGDFARVTTEGEFHPRGRAGEQELPELEAALLQHPGVADAIAVRAGFQVYAAVVADPGRDLEAELKRAFPSLARVLVLPRLPRTSTGRPRRMRVLERFGCTTAGSPLPFELHWREDVRTDERGVHRHVFRVHIPRDYGHFAGHFAGYPILPGAAQLSELVLPCVRRARPDLGRLEQMTRIKFSGRIQPGEQIAIGLSWRDGERTLDFTLHRDDTLCAAGRLSFATGAAA